MDRLSAFAVIRDRSLFRLLKKVDAFELAGLAKVVEVPAGQPVPRDDRTDALWVVVEGRVDLVERTGENEQVASVTKGRSLELATFRAAKETWKYDWIAERETTLLRLPGDAVRAKIRNTPGLERYLDLVIADPGVRRFKNDLRLFGFGDETIRIVARMTLVPWSELSAEQSKRPGLVLVERGALSVELLHVRKRHGLGPFTPGDYIYVGEGMGTVTGGDDVRVWYLPREAWEKESSAERVESFLGLADPVTLKKSALGKLTIPGAATLARQKPKDDDVDELGVKDFKLPKEELAKLFKKRRPVVLQHDEMDCGAACLATVAEFYGRKIGIPRYRSLVHVTREGASLAALKRAAELTGMRSIGVMSGLNGLRDVRAPLIALMQYHFVVVWEIKDDVVVAMDPARGLLEIPHDKFKQEWSGNALLLDPTPELLKQPKSPPIWTNYLPLLRGSGPALFEILLASLLVYGLGLALPVFLQYFVDSILPSGKADVLGLFAAGLFGILGLQAGIGWVRKYLLVHVTSRMDAMFSTLFVRRLLELPLGFFAVRTVGDITKRMQEIQTIRQIVLDETLNVVTLVVGGGLNLVVLGLYSETLLVVLLGCFAVAAGWIFYLGPKLLAKLREVLKAESAWQTRSWEQFDGLASIKAIHGEIAARWKWSNELLSALEVRRSLGFLEGLSMATTQLLDHGIRAVLLVWAIVLFSKGELTAGHVLATSLLSGVVVTSAMTLLESWHKFNELGVSLARVDDVITAAEEPRGAPSTGKKLALTGKVELENVTFQYGGELSPIVLDQLSFAVEANETVAIVGRSGSGKTTLGYMFNLLHPPTQGAILFDGQRHDALPLAELRRQVAMVVQDNSIFSGTILENIALGDPNPSFKDVVDAAQLADAHEFIAALPDGYSTMLGELGEGLSGGQRQRINIARALYRKPAILVMDEATSALDAISEAKILKNLKSRRGTTIVIAHRLNTVMLADRIVVLDAGRAAEMGTHNELMTKRGIYHRLFAKQLAL